MIEMYDLAQTLGTNEPAKLIGQEGAWGQINIGLNAMLITSRSWEITSVMVPLLCSQPKKDPHLTSALRAQ